MIVITYISFFVGIKEEKSKNIEIQKMKLFEEGRVKYKSESGIYIIYKFCLKFAFFFFVSLRCLF